jgi:hypothetical protein
VDSVNGTSMLISESLRSETQPNMIKITWLHICKNITRAINLYVTLAVEVREAIVLTRPKMQVFP